MIDDKQWHASIKWDELQKAEEDALIKLRATEVARHLYAKSMRTAQPVDVNTIERRDSEWIVPHYVPRGHLTNVAGIEGIGKGLFAVWVTVQAVRSKHKALIMSTEDADTEVRNRLEAAGLKMRDGVVFYEETPMDIEELSDYVEEHGITLIVMDALRDFMPIDGRRGTFNDDSYVRPALHALRRLAHDKNIAILGLHHFNKADTDTNGNPLTVRQMFSGSAAFQAAPRHVLALVRIEDEHVVGVYKSNIHQRGWMRHFTVEETTSSVPRFKIGEVGEFDQRLELDAWIKASRGVKSEVSFDEKAEIVRRTLCEQYGSADKPPAARSLWEQHLKAVGVANVTVGEIYENLRKDGVIAGTGKALAWGSAGGPC